MPPAVCREPHIAVSPHLTRLARTGHDARRACGGDPAEPQGDGGANRRSPGSSGTLAGNGPRRNPLVLPALTGRTTFPHGVSVLL